MRAEEERKAREKKAAEVRAEEERKAEAAAKLLLQPAPLGEDWWTSILSQYSSLAPVPFQRTMTGNAKKSEITGGMGGKTTRSSVSPSKAAMAAGPEPVESRPYQRTMTRGAKKSEITGGMGGSAPSSPIAPSTEASAPEWESQMAGRDPVSTQQRAEYTLSLIHI